MKKDDRYLIQILDDISKESNIEITKTSHNWIVQLKKDSVCKYIFGYNFEINSSTAQMLAQDKSALSEVLKLSGIPVVEHKLFFSTRMEQYVPKDGNWLQIIKYFEKNNNQVVVKLPKGSSGHNVYLAKTQLELEKSIHHLFSKHYNICLSPFFKIKKEYRVIVLNKKVELLYSKKSPFVKGDGISTLNELLFNKYGLFNSISSEEIISKTINNIPAQNETITFNWKNNLGKGATAQIIEQKHEKHNKITELAINASDAININFASVDIIETEGNELFVLEINSGVMTEHLLKSNPDKYNFIKAIYKKAVMSMFK